MANEHVRGLSRASTKPDAARAATATVVVDDRPVGSAEIPFAMRAISSVGSTVGHDHGMPVSDRYESAFPFEGVHHGVDIRPVRVIEPVTSWDRLRRTR